MSATTTNDSRVKFYSAYRSAWSRPVPINQRDRLQAPLAPASPPSTHKSRAKKGSNGTVSKYEDYRPPPSPQPQSQTTSCPGQTQVNETLLTLLHDTSCTSTPPCPLMGAPHTYFHRCVSLADGARSNARSPHLVQVLGALQTITQMEARGFPWCALHSPSAKKMSAAEGVRDPTWSLKQLALHMDWYSGYCEINCIFTGTKLEITQRAINAEICLCAAKISDKKPIRQFLPYVLEWVFFKQILVECNGRDQPRSSKEAAHFQEESEFCQVSCTSNHVLDMPPKGDHTCTSFLSSMQKEWPAKCVDKTEQFLRSLLLGGEKPRMWSLWWQGKGTC